MDRIDPFEQIRVMQLNKIKINNSKQWDVAQYDDYVAKEGQDYYEKRRKTRLKSKKKAKGKDGL